MPFLQGRYEEERACAGSYDSHFLNMSRLSVQEELLKRAREAHLKNSREKVETHQLGLIRKFARNLALLQGGLSPDFYQLLMASRGMVNDNFGYEVWDLGSHYPFQEATPPLPEIEVTAEDLRLNQKQIRFYRRFRTFRRRLVPVPLKKRPSDGGKGGIQKALERTVYLLLSPGRYSSGRVGRLCQEKGPGCFVPGTGPGGPLFFVLAGRAGYPGNIAAGCGK